MPAYGFRKSLLRDWGCRFKKHDKAKPITFGGTYGGFLSMVPEALLKGQKPE